MHRVNSVSFTQIVNLEYYPSCKHDLKSPIKKCVGSYYPQLFHFRLLGWKCKQIFCPCWSPPKKPGVCKTGQRRRKRVVMVIWIPWGDISTPHLLSPQVCILSTSQILLFLFLSHCIYLCLTIPFLCLSLCLFVYGLPISLRLFPLNVFFFPSFIMFPFLSSFFCPCGPHLLSMRRGREKQRKERNANFIATVMASRRRDWERGKENVTRLRKWDGHCIVCAHVSACVSTGKIRVTVWVTFRVFFLCLAPPPSKWYICIYMCAGGKWWYMYVACQHFFFFCHLVLKPFSALFVSQVNHVRLLLFPHSGALSSPLTHVGNVIMFRSWTEAKTGSLVGGKEGVNESLEQTWGRGRKSHWYVYPITTPASPKSPSQRIDARTLKIATSIPPPLCVLVTVVMR